MQTLSALFDSYEEARLAVYDLEDSGIQSDDITFISKGGAPQPDDSSLKSVGAGVGAALGGAGGMLAGMAGFVLPGIGPVVGIGALATTLAGAAAGSVTGGLIGLLIEAGMDDGEAQVFAEGIKRGGTLVSVRVHEHEIVSTTALLKRHHPVDTIKRRKEYEGAGWTGFSSDDPWDEAIGSEDN